MTKEIQDLLYFALLARECANGRLRLSVVFALLLTACWMPEEPDTSINGTDSLLSKETGIATERPSNATPASFAPATDGNHTSDNLERPSGGVLRIEIPVAFIPDPAVVGFPHDYLFHGEVYSGLTRISDDPNVLFELDLAESFNVSDGGQTYRFLLRPDLKFSDGSPLTAADVKWSWERSLIVNRDSGYANAILGLIRGATEIAEQETVDLDGVEVIDDRTLIVRLERPIAHFPALLGHPAASILRRQNVEQWGFDWSKWRNPELSESGIYIFEELPVGTGPFRVDHFDFSRNVVILKSNQYYWNDPPQLERIEFVEYDTDNHIADTVELLRRRRSDFTFALGSPSVTSASVHDEIYGTVQSDSFRIETVFLLFNTRTPPFDNLHFRKALAISARCSMQSWHSTKEADPIREMSMNPLGSYSYVPSDGIIPPDNPAYKNTEATSSPNCSDAIQELKLSGFNYDREIIWKFDHSYSPEIIRYLIDGWKTDLNLDIILDEVDDQSMYVRMFNAGFIPMSRVSVTPLYPDPHAILGFFDGLFKSFRSAQTRDEDPEKARILVWLEEAVSEQDAALRLTKYREIARYLEDMAIVVPMFWSEGKLHARYQPWINGYSPPAYYGSRFHDVWIDTNHPDYFEINPPR